MTSSPQFDSSLRAPSLTHNGGRALSVGISRSADATCLTFIPALWAAATMAAAWSGLSAAFTSRVRLAIRVAGRTEEHTSELQSLMRNSYAVFCLKKKQTKYKRQIYTIL